jgi:CheY-like chemotaxis protein
MANARPRILCVDDDPNLLEAIARNLVDAFDVTTAEGGEEALARMSKEAPFSVVVSDMRMPSMDGATFLAHAKERAPDTVRVLLTGQADISAAVAAVNQGSIFQFVRKPCTPDELARVLSVADAQHQLVLAERDVLARTLNGAVSMLADVLSLTAPAAFGRANRMKWYVGHLVQELGIADGWQYEVAASLSHVGCIALPTGLAEKAWGGGALSAAERETFEGHWDTGYRLLCNIPRLDVVAEIVRAMRRGAPAAGRADVARGVLLLRLALDVDDLVTRGKSVRDAVDRLAATGKHEASLLQKLSTLRGAAVSSTIRFVRVRDLPLHGILEDDVCTVSGALIVPKGREVTWVLLERLRTFAGSAGLVEPIRVRVP